MYRLFGLYGFVCKRCERAWWLSKKMERTILYCPFCSCKHDFEKELQDEHDDV